MTAETFNPSLNPADWPEKPNERAAYLERLLHKVICVGCDTTPRSVWMGLLTGESNYGLKCNCWPELPKPVQQIYHVDERRWNMVKKEIARRPDDLPAITKKDVKDHLASKATDGELELFVRFCVSEELNPFAREAYLVKIQEQPAYIQVDYKVFLKRAHRDPDYRYYESGVVVLDANGELADRVGAMRGPNDTLYGGWVKVYMAGKDKPIEARVMLKNFEKRKRDGNLTSFWATMPEFMIEKVAINTGFRRAIRGLEDLLAAGGAMRVEMAEVEGEAVEALEAANEASEPPEDDPSVGGLYEPSELPLSPADEQALEQPTESDGGPPLFPPKQASESPESKPKITSETSLWKALEKFGLNKKEHTAAVEKLIGQPLAQAGSLQDVYDQVAHEHAERTYRTEQEQPAENTDST
jgi:phage recombination protein Bet